MIIDCFTFYNELELLEIRLHELEHVVDKFVLVESMTTFTGLPKPLVFQQNKEKFARFNIEHVICPTLEHPQFIHKNPWVNEEYQRNYIEVGLARLTLDPKDVIIVSDVDELISAEALDLARQDDVFSHNVVAFEQKMYYYYLNNYAYTMGWAGSKACEYRNFSSAQELRQRSANVLIEDGGWHFSYMGGVDRISSKLQAFSHQELRHFNNPANLEDALKTNRDLFNREEKFIKVPIDKSYPSYIIENIDKFKELICE